MNQSCRLQGSCLNTELYFSASDCIPPHHRHQNKVFQAIKATANCLVHAVCTCRIVNILAPFDANVCART